MIPLIHPLRRQRRSLDPIFPKHFFIGITMDLPMSTRVIMLRDEPHIDTDMLYVIWMVVVTLAVAVEIGVDEQ